MLIVTEKVLAEYGKVILELIEKGLTDTDKANILETLQKLTSDFRNNGQNGQYKIGEEIMLCSFSEAMRCAKKDIFSAAADYIKTALDRYYLCQKKRQRNSTHPSGA